ncbi:transporter [Roseovarius faecimaris]|uniref:Transporter n=1 Tax=Roseovarius faecimaris TaxID=2494550 RepID=A0A6I6ISH6_9RHOB|nr:transporter [Roseovarius faecimaris]QGX99655.1 transporter [Roseovarius faecimaris]
MTLKKLTALCLGAGLAMSAPVALAGDKMTGDMTHQTNMDHKAMGHGGMGHAMHAHGPIGVMGRHLLPKGKVMLGYRFGHMSMDGLRLGTSDLTADQAATTQPNRFAGMPGMPPTLRVIPDSMTTEMHMISAMYGLSDNVTVMAMVPYIEKDMTAITYQGPVGTTVLGTSKRHSEGLGDIRIGATMGLLTKGPHRLNATLGLSLPTGSITETGQMFTPMGMRPTRRLGYAMQLGSGTYDLRPALTYQASKGAISYGAQLRGTIRLGSNDEGYSLGDEIAATAWVSYRAAPWVSLSGRAEAARLGRIDGIDVNIGGASPGADPLSYGGDRVTLFAGADFSPQQGLLKGHKFGVELGVPVYQDLNGPMLKTDWMLGLAWRTSF